MRGDLKKTTGLIKLSQVSSLKKQILIYIITIWTSDS